MESCLFSLKKHFEYWEEVFKVYATFPWLTENVVVYEDGAVVLRRFKLGTTGKAILMIPPQAGHSSPIADFDEGKSLVQTAINSCEHSVYVIEWKTCTYERRRETVDDLVDQVKTVLDCIEDKVFLVGLCQGGWLSSIVTCLYPEKVEKLILAGSPMNIATAREKSSVCKYVEDLPLSFYHLLVLLGGGLMKGDFMLAGWKNSNFVDRYIIDYMKMWRIAGTDKMSALRRYRNWYECTQDIAGTWYLDVVERMFINNDLWEGCMEVKGQCVRIQDIQCPIISVAGGRDDITPPEQALALDGEHYTIPNTGHIGVFMSSKAQPVWADIFGGL